jgi:hypothetical protein
MNDQVLRVFFVIAGLYDGLLGAAFLLFPGRLFTLFDVTPPNHMGYVQFSALLLIVFAAMLFRIATNPVRHRELILYGCALKVSYCGVVFWYELSEGIPNMWMPFAWADLVFLVLFGLIWKNLGKRALVV